MTHDREREPHMAASPASTSTRASQDTIVTASALSKGFGDRQVVSGLSFSVARGRAYGLLGPNGSGKTTTVRMLTGLLTPDQGDVALFGEPVNATSADGLRRRIGVQTDTNLYDTLSARENLRTWGALYGVAPRALNERVDEVLDVLGLSARANSLAGEFSKGMKQKLAIGRAILHQPELLFLDEPTAGLDPEASADLIEYLTQMIRSLNTTVIVCTHQLHGLETLCDDIGIIRSGELLSTGAVDDLLRRRWPEHRYTLTVGGDPARAAHLVSSIVGRTPGTSSDGVLTFSAPDRARVPELVTALVGESIPVHSIVPVTPTIEQYYFATLNEEAL